MALQAPASSLPNIGTLSRQRTGSLFASRTGANDPTAPVKRERIRLYKEYLTPALHRRFTGAAALVLVLCWLEAWIFSSSNHFLWSWFPIGLTGLRTLLLFLSCLPVFIVRVANMHFGEQTTTSPVETVYAHVATPKRSIATLVTIGWYVFSACMFGETYIWSRTEEAYLGWIDPGRAYERMRLNENPIALRCLFVVVGISQAILHLARDTDRLAVVENETQSIPAQAGSSAASSLQWLLKRLQGRLSTIVSQTLKLTILAPIFGWLPAYYFFLRHFAWKAIYPIARVLVHDLPPTAKPTGFIQVPKIMWQAFSSVFLLVLLWELSNAAFDIFAAQPPLRDQQPLTSGIKSPQGRILHASNDPNGSLMTGLKSKKELPKTFAFWELYLICTQFEQRRKSIYDDVDRREESGWKQIYKYTMAEIELIQERIEQANEPLPLEFRAQQKESELQNEQTKYLLGREKQEEMLGLPKIADQTVKDNGAVFAKQQPDMVHTLGNLAKSIGQSPGAGPVGPRAKKMIEWGTDRVLSKEDQEKLSRQRMEQYAGSYAASILRQQFGEPFRRTFARTANAVIFGIPHSNAINIVHAIKSLTRLVVCSLAEDKFGQVAPDVAKIVRAFTALIKDIENFVQTLQPHWTDVMFTERDRDVKEIREMLDVLKGGLEEILLGFEEYAKTVKLSRLEIREAKTAAASNRPPTSAQIGT